MEAKIIPHFHTTFEGVPIEVSDARISQCPQCGEKLYSANELKRWKSIKEAALANRGQLPSGADVRRLREGYGLSVADIANLLGVTRQTVHVWERSESEFLKSGPAAVLTLLLLEGLRENNHSVLLRLVSWAKQRGQSLSDPTALSRIAGAADPTKENASPLQNLSGHGYSTVLVHPEMERLRE